MIEFIKDFGMILLACKSLGILSKRLGIPQVVGEIVGGLILGPCFLDLIESGDIISLFAEIGVLLMMFSTGLGTNIRQLIRTGKTAFWMALVGVIVPLLGGTLLYSCMYGVSDIGSKDFFSAVFIGTIMTATSVSITVATLQELGKINTELGTTIVSAAIIDDVIGMIVLTCVIGAASGQGGSFGLILAKTIAFFVFALVVGYIVNRVMEFLDKKIHIHKEFLFFH